MVCLNDEEMKEIVENGQLRTNQLFSQRTKMIQKFMGINLEQKISNNEKNQKIEMMQEKLKNEELTKNQKKNLKKRLRKEKKKQNESQIQKDEK